MFELRKIGIVKRASAWLLDVILLAVLASGFMFVISLICDYNGAQKLASTYYSEWDDFRKEYIPEVAEQYGFVYEADDELGTYTIKTEDGAKASLSDVLMKLRASEGNDPETAKAFEAYQKLQTETPVEKVNAQYRYVYSLLFMMISVGLALSYLLLEFVVPLLFKNGQTIGKKVFGICLVRPDCVKINHAALFARTILGKFAAETMFPILLVFLFFFGGLGILAVILFIALFLLNIGLFLFTKNRTPIHDIFASTVAADMSLQMIYESEEALIEKKKAEHKEFIDSVKS